MINFKNLRCVALCFAKVVTYPFIIGAANEVVGAALLEFGTSYYWPIPG